MSDLQELLGRCKCGVYLTVNEHRDVYETAAEWIEAQPDWADDIPADVRKRMEETDTVVNLRFYPSTPVGFYIILHYDASAAIDQANQLLEHIEKEGGRR